jgi:hypothetical protein
MVYNALQMRRVKHELSSIIIDLGLDRTAVPDSLFASRSSHTMATKRSFLPVAALQWSA